MFKLKTIDGDDIGSCNSISHLLRTIEHHRMNVIVEDSDGSLFSMSASALEKNMVDGKTYHVLNRADLSITEFLLEKI